ncbi:uncharacterized protein DFL_009237 [Arthrobotrys flagrans]|uniref:Uncharacterized protein n=1 Tax=Arthrobotrys flagrans TaxID=97331 RepID=A0A436ZR39_ARTFL|nr:hypothetical protein DFL_009237 [Arthrobotrys flagrans]
MGVTTNWVPVTEEDKKLAQAISKLAESPKDVFVIYTEPTGEVKNRFILNSQGINDLQKYVLMGMQFPGDNAKFEAKMPKSYFATITKIDSTIWERTRDEFVKISVSCKKFHDENLYRILNAASTTRNYAGRALHDLSVAKFVNLRENLLILLDEKYRRAPPDEDYKDARDAAVRTLKKLERDAKSSKADLVEIINGLRVFKGETEILRTDIMALGASYDKKHKVEDGSTKTLSEIADAEHARVLKDIEAAEADWAKKTGMKRGVDISVFILQISGAPGKVVAFGVHLYSEHKLKSDIEDAKSRVGTLNNEKASVAKLITYVAALKSQFKSIDESMSKAIKAMQDLDALFDNQQACFEELIEATDAINKDMDETSYKARCGGIMDGVDTAIANIGKLQQSADEFYRFHSEEKVTYENFKIWD